MKAGLPLLEQLIIVSLPYFASRQTTIAVRSPALDSRPRLFETLWFGAMFRHRSGVLWFLGRYWPKHYGR
jgi:hypothetical protein